MVLEGWFEKACSLLSSAWRAQGAPESDEIASQEFLKQLAEEYAARADIAGLRSEWGPRSGRSGETITIDDNGYDCRVGKRASKRRREAKKTADVKHRGSDIKAGGLSP